MLNSDITVYCILTFLIKEICILQISKLWNICLTYLCTEKCLQLWSYLMPYITTFHFKRNAIWCFQFANTNHIWVGHKWNFDVRQFWPSLIPIRPLCVLHFERRCLINSQFNPLSFYRHIFKQYTNCNLKYVSVILVMRNICHALYRT